MFTFSIMYVIIYLLIMLCLLSLICYFNSPVLFFRFSMLKNLTFIQKYTIHRKLYFIIFFCLTGLPPFGLFFIKFNIFFACIYQLKFISLITVFIVFFSMMLFYSQIFIFKNKKFNTYSFVNSGNLEYFKEAYSFSKRKSGFAAYKQMLFITNCLFLILLMFFFVFDYFLIINVF